MDKNKIDKFMEMMMMAVMAAICGVVVIALGKVALWIWNL